jgi:hypothetical protein
MIRMGHFVSLVCGAFSIAFAALFYWDIQDGSFSTRTLFGGIAFAVMCIAFLFFPGGSMMFSELAAKNSSAPIDEWMQSIPRLHKRVWLAAGVLSIYLALWAEDYLTGARFFTVGRQATLVASAGLVLLIVRWYFKRKQK